MTAQAIPTTQAVAVRASPPSDTAPRSPVISSSCPVSPRLRSAPVGRSRPAGPKRGVGSRTGPRADVPTATATAPPRLGSMPRNDASVAAILPLPPPQSPPVWQGEAVQIDAQAFWLRAPGCGEIRPVALPEPGQDDVLVRT